MKCEKCGYEWQPRVKMPKACPECKTRLRAQRRRKRMQEEHGRGGA